MESIVLLSGGQDSTTCLAWAKQELGAGVRAVAFDYGQRHSVELKQAAEIADRLGVISFSVLNASVLHDLGGAALTDDRVDVEAMADPRSLNQHAYKHNLPSTFVPGRNMREEMEDRVPIESRVPFEVEIKVGHRWGDLEKVKDLPSEVFAVEEA